MVVVVGVRVVDGDVSRGRSLEGCCRIGGNGFRMGSWQGAAESGDRGSEDIPERAFPVKGRLADFLRTICAKAVSGFFLLEDLVQEFD